MRTIDACPDNPISLKKGATSPAMKLRIPKTSSKKTANETGIVSFSSKSVSDLNSLLKLADEALYNEKKLKKWFYKRFNNK